MRDFTDDTRLHGRDATSRETRGFADRRAAVRVAATISLRADAAIDRARRHLGVRAAIHPRALTGVRVRGRVRGIAGRQSRKATGTDDEAAVPKKAACPRQRRARSDRDAGQRTR